MESRLQQGVRSLRSNIHRWRTDPREVWGLPTGFPTLDRMTGGMHPGQMIAVGGRTHHGKTAFLNQVTMHVAETLFTEGRPGRVCLFSPEMQPEDIILRLAANMSGVTTTAIQSGYATDEQYALFDQSVELVSEIGDSVLWMHAGKPIELPTIQSFVEMADVNRDPITLLVIDYLTYVRVPAVYNDVQAAGEVSRTLSELAAEYHIPILVGAQLKRAFEERNIGTQDAKEPLPVLSDFSQSGKIETDAAQAWMLYNPPDDGRKSNDQHQPALLLVRKNRSTGKTGPVQLAFDNRLGVFHDRATLRRDTIPAL